MLSGESIICFSSTEWIGRNKTSKRYLMEIFSRTNKVLFVETIGSRSPGLNKMHFSMIFKRLSKCFRGAVKPQDLASDQNLWVYSPVVIPFHHIGWVRKMNQWILTFALRSLMRQLGMKNPILWFYLPTASLVIGHLSEKKVVYHAVDEWSTYPGFRGGAYQDMDDQLFRKSNIVFASNRKLLELKKKVNSNIHYVPHGVNFEDYQVKGAQRMPADLDNKKHPIIAMIGAVSSWIDWEPILLLARKHPDWSILMIGPIGYDAELNPIKDISNIYLLGAKNYIDLPAYYQSIEVCIVSFRLTEHIRYCCPTRLYEHLANGKPIVSSDFPAAHEFPEDLVKVAKTPEDFDRLVREALRETGNDWVDRRKKLAQGNTWTNRAELMTQLMKENS